MSLLLLLLSLLTAHDYHVSKTNLRYVADREQLQVEMHVFVDDLEEAMQEAGAPLLNLGTPDQEAESDRFLMAYLDKHFTIGWNGEPLPLQLVGYELEDDLHGLWIYLVAEEVTAADELRVQQTVLTEYYADQKNIVKVFDGQERVATLLMDRGRPTDTATFARSR